MSADRLSIHTGRREKEHSRQFIFWPHGHPVPSASMGDPTAVLSDTKSTMHLCVDRFRLVVRLRPSNRRMMSVKLYYSLRFITPALLEVQRRWTVTGCQVLYVEAEKPSPRRPRELLCGGDASVSPLIQLTLTYSSDILFNSCFCSTQLAPVFHCIVPIRPCRRLRSPTGSTTDTVDMDTGLRVECSHVY